MTSSRGRRPSSTKVPEAARILARRFNGRAKYRRRRDRVIAADHIGRTYRLWDERKLIGTDVRLVEYDPRSHQVTFLDAFLYRRTIDTDEYWKLIRNGRLYPR